MEEGGADQSAFFLFGQAILRSGIGIATGIGRNGTMMRSTAMS